MPTESEIRKFNEAAAQYAAEAGIPLEEAMENLGNLLKNMTEDPTSTALFFARSELTTNQRFEVLEARVTYIESVMGGTVVGADPMPQ